MKSVIQYQNCKNTKKIDYSGIHFNKFRDRRICDEKSLKKFGVETVFTQKLLVHLTNNYKKIASNTLKYDFLK